jgi:hypothetical protein
MMFLMRRNRQSGQVALIILLVMVVVLTVGLSLISHSVTDISISKDEEEAMRAFSAAEAGIEEALRQEDLLLWAPGETPKEVNVDEMKANVTVVAKNEIENKVVAENDFLNVNLEGFSGTVNIEWEYNGDTPVHNAAIEVVLYDANNQTIDRYAYSPLGTCASSDFSLPIPGPTRVNNIPVGVNDDLMRIRVLCHQTTLKVTANGGTLPTQEYQIDSRAAAGGQAKGKTSAIEVSRTISSLPSIFDYVLFSGGNIE